MNILGIGHPAYNCKDVAVSTAFYTDVLGFKVKFRLYYRDWIDHLKKNAAAEGKEMDPEFLAKYENILDTAWITYIEVAEGQFLELFDAAGAEIRTVPDGFTYNHLAIVTDDIHELHKYLVEKGAPIDTPPSFGLENTWQMWSHDPDGNKIEFMQYTPESWQLVGR